MGCSCEWKSVVGFLFHLIGDGFAVLLICIAFGTDKYILIHFYFSSDNILIHFHFSRGHIWSTLTWSIIDRYRSSSWMDRILGCFDSEFIISDKWIKVAFSSVSREKSSETGYGSFYPNKPNRILNVFMFLISKCINIFMVPHSQPSYHRLFTSLVSDLENNCQFVQLWILCEKLGKLFDLEMGSFSHLFVFFTLKCNISNV